MNEAPDRSRSRWHHRKSQPSSYVRRERSRLADSMQAVAIAERRRTASLSDQPGHRGFHRTHQTLQASPDVDASAVGRILARHRAGLETGGSRPAYVSTAVATTRKAGLHPLLQPGRRPTRSLWCPSAAPELQGCLKDPWSIRRLPVDSRHEERDELQFQNLAVNIRNSHRCDRVGISLRQIVSIVSIAAGLIHPAEPLPRELCGGMETEDIRRLKGWRRPDAAAGERAWTSRR